MISNKHFNIIVALFMVIALCFSSLIMLLPKSSTSSTSIEQPDYITTIFNDDSVIEINIEMDEDSWQEMLDNAASEEYTAANITVNGTTYNNVAIRPKGNSSLSQLVTDDSTERYSFKIKLDKYVDGQTLDGLSKLVLNNNMSDTTSMKEYLSYKLLDSLGIPTPACSYAHITVNGEEWGLYLAVEPIEEEFIERNYGSIDGNLYKPESDNVAMGDKDNNENKIMDNNNFSPSENTTSENNNKTTIDNSIDMQNQSNMNNGDSSGQMQMPPDMNTGNSTGEMQAPPDMNNGNPSREMQTPPDMNNGDSTGEIQTPPDMNKQSTNDSTNQPQIPNGIGGGIGRNSNGANLVWNGDDISNYSAIFDNAIFKTTNSDDYTKILDMIEHLDSLDDIESYLDVDEVLKYFAANTFLVNLDSYVSNMNHNYYLYENDGIVSILPWDYNLSFAGFQAGSASNAINFPIDSPVSDSLEESPLIGKLLEVDEYKDIYHHYLNEIVENFVNNGTLETLITKTDSLISSYIQNDATAFYTYDEYKASLSNLINFGYDRATSIAAQLDGSQPSTNTGTIETTVDLSAMGQQGGGNEKGEMNNMRGSSDTTPPNADSSTPQSDNTTESSMNIPNSNTTSNFPGNISSNTSDLDPSIMMQAMQIIQSSEDGSITDSIKTELLNLGLTNEEITQLSSIQIPNQDNNGMHDIKNNNLAMGPGNISTDNTNLIITLSSIVLLVIALVFVSFFKKRKYIS
ncbi:CotH kinase family protein [Clostridium disporicum]|uniref:Spore coat assembly protein-like protein n=3 Tax=Clostridiaceae TaxID=31979 RepID=A0A173Y1K8_9CLOT|nr:CotH kinase family protein [Clostridium disporicum]CUN56785.1 spore coat assembly protein-like protein [Clostridium disporicum]